MGTSVTNLILWVLVLSETLAFVPVRKPISPRRTDDIEQYLMRATGFSGLGQRRYSGDEEEDAGKGKNPPPRTVGTSLHVGQAGKYSNYAPFGLPLTSLQESTKTAPYSSLPHRYTDAPTSFHALNTYVKEANVIKRKKKKAGKDKFEAGINSIKVGEIHGISTTKPPSKSEEESKKTDDDVTVVKDSPVALPLTSNEQDGSKSTSGGISNDNLAVESVFQTIELKPGSRKPKRQQPSYENDIDADFKASQKAGFVPSKEGPPIDPPTLSSQFRGSEYQLSSRPIDSPFGVSVDFAGTPADNPLYKPKEEVIHRQILPNKEVFQRDIVPDNIYVNNLASTGGLYRHQWTTSGIKKPVVDPTVEREKYLARLAAVSKSYGAPSEAHSKYMLRHPITEKSTTRPSSSSTTTAAIFDPYLDTNVAPPEPPKSASSPASSTTTTIHTYPGKDKSIFYLSPSGPRMPVFDQLTTDLEQLMTGFLRGDEDNAVTVVESRHKPHTITTYYEPVISDPYYNDEPLSTRMGHVFNKLMGAHYGDRSFDIFDWIPLIALLVASGLIISGLFPNGINSFGLTNGNLVLNARKDDETVIEQALGHLESGILMMSALKYEGACAERLACRLGDLARDSFDDKDMLLGAVNMILPEKYNNFSRSFENVFRDDDRSACQKECYRCISL